MMKNSSSEIFYQRHLPHFNPKESPIFITFRLANTLPALCIKGLKEEREKSLKIIAELKDQKKKMEEYGNMQRNYFLDFDNLLHKNDNNINWLKEPIIAKIIKESIHFRDYKDYDLISYVIMPNHVHILFIPLTSCTENNAQAYKTSHLLKSLKWHTAKECNKVLKRNGQFWQQESYDHVVRNDKEMIRIVKYILNNPVKAGMVEKPEDWEWSYVNHEKLFLRPQVRLAVIYSN